MKSDAITVELRLSAKAESKVKAFADITIPLGDDGTHNPGFLSTRWRRAPPEAYESCAKGQAGLVRHSTAERKNSVVCRRGSTRRVRPKNESLEIVGGAVLRASRAVQDESKSVRATSCPLSRPATRRARPELPWVLLRMLRAETKSGVSEN